MMTICFSAIKGGVGKSSLAILTANIIAASGHKVLCIDADPQNSMTFYYLPDSRELSQSLAKVLLGEELKMNIVKTGFDGIDLLPSSLELFNCKNINNHTLAKTLKNIKEYDYCVIDTAPTIDTITFNSLLAADKIITPVQFSNFDYKSALFYKKIITDLNISSRWYLAMNRYKTIKTGNSIAGQFFQIYSSSFDSICHARIPDSAVIKQYFDTAAKINQSKSKLQIYNSLKSFVQEIINKKIEAEAF